MTAEDASDKDLGGLNKVRTLAVSCPALTEKQPAPLFVDEDVMVSCYGQQMPRLM